MIFNKKDVEEYKDLLANEEKELYKSLYNKY